jgi:hypothetical protein
MLYVINLKIHPFYCGVCEEKCNKFNYHNLIGEDSQNKV